MRTASPPPISPRPPPSARCRQRLWHRVIAMRPARPAAHDPRQPHPATRPKPEPPDGVTGEFRATRRVPTGPPHEHGQRVAITGDQHDGDTLERQVHHAPEEIDDSL